MTAPTITAVMVIFLSVSAYAQSDETCIAYMEADAIYKIANLDAYEAAEKTNARCGGFFVAGTDEETAMRLACEAQRAAYTETLQSFGVDERVVEDRANKAARAAEEGVERAAMKAAREERTRAYAAVYKGPTSAVENIMAKLIKADRKRCRQRLE